MGRQSVPGKRTFLRTSVWMQTSAACRSNRRTFNVLDNNAVVSTNACRKSGNNSTRRQKQKKCTTQCSRNGTACLSGSCLRRDATSLLQALRRQELVLYAGE